jgi:hypothetical protein
MHCSQSNLICENNIFETAAVESPEMGVLQTSKFCNTPVLYCLSSNFTTERVVIG